jgi:hypothetical protein
MLGRLPSSDFAAAVKAANAVASIIASSLFMGYLLFQWLKFFP